MYKIINFIDMTAAFLPSNFGTVQVFYDLVSSRSRLCTEQTAGSKALYCGEKSDRTVEFEYFGASLGGCDVTSSTCRQLDQLRPP